MNLHTQCLGNSDALCRLYTGGCISYTETRLRMRGKDVGKKSMSLPQYVPRNVFV